MFHRFFISRLTIGVRVPFWVSRFVVQSFVTNVKVYKRSAGRFYGFIWLNVEWVFTVICVVTSREVTKLAISIIQGSGCVPFTRFIFASRVTVGRDKGYLRGVFSFSIPTTGLGFTPLFRIKGRKFGFVRLACCVFVCYRCYGRVLASLLGAGHWVFISSGLHLLSVVSSALSTC